MNGEVISAAVTGSIKIFKALKKFFNDSQITNTNINANWSVGE